MHTFSLKSRYKTYAIFVGFSTAITMFCFSANAKRIAGPHTATQSMLDAFHRSLVYFKKDCGRYPTTEEGLEALLVAPKSLPCKEKSHWNINPRWLEKPITDPWKQIIQYTSDGNTYRIQASHGYFVTNTSPSQKGSHWENVGPVPDDSHPPKRPGMAD